MTEEATPKKRRSKKSLKDQLTNLSNEELVQLSLDIQALLIERRRTIEEQLKTIDKCLPAVQPEVLPAVSPKFLNGTAGNPSEFTPRTISAINLFADLRSNLSEKESEAHFVLTQEDIEMLEREEQAQREEMLRRSAGGNA